jgi:uncharacterized metal-binding protein YceD (DUF177 family)
MKEFVIPFFGLKMGAHKFKFEIGPSFFEAFENSPLQFAQFRVKVKLEKFNNMLILKFKAKGEIDDYCDRCGDALQVKMSSKDEIYVKFGDEEFGQTDEIIVVPQDTHEIDVSHLIYEMIVLNLPGKRLHSKIKDCNQEVIQKLKNEALKNQVNEIDPRWEGLNKLK